MHFGAISQQNLGSMVNMIGAADQQMATQAGNGMSATPQGVEAQQEMVDITTNNYQKAIESFFSHYCSYALTVYFEELKGVKAVKPTADARAKLLDAGMPPEVFQDDGTVVMDFSKLATEYFVRCVPGSLTELEDEKQLRILNQLLVPLSQAMPAMAASQDQQAVSQASKAMQYIIAKQIELSGSSSAKQLGLIVKGEVDEQQTLDTRIGAIEGAVNGMHEIGGEENETLVAAITQQQQQISLLMEGMQTLFKKLGVITDGSETNEPEIASA